MKKHLFLFLISSIIFSPAFPEDFYKDVRQDWLKKSELYKPTLVKKEKKPISVVNVVPDKEAFQG
ncbi:MAG: hypothetical protein LUG18_14150 [Candidatus Azobacteroides sp.]|nr:hypothetical protein [Candidatus Azobacteroides sp.]